MNFKINNRKPDFFPKAKGILRGSMELRIPRQYNMNQAKVEVVIEIPRGSFLKRGWNGTVDFVSPFPCPFNYGAIPDYIGGEGDLLDAVVLGPRLPRGKRVSVVAQGAVGLTDRGIPLPLFGDRFFKQFVNVPAMTDIVNFYNLTIIFNPVNDPKSLCLHGKIT